jgi:hypothetical protein
MGNGVERAQDVEALTPGWGAEENSHHRPEKSQEGS